MLKFLHTWPTLLAGVLVTVMAVSGSVLSLEPALTRVTSPVPVVETSASLADLAAGVSAHFSETQRIVQKADGQVIVYHGGNTGMSADLVDPRTGAPLGAYKPSPFFQTVTDLHRSLLAGDTGRIATGAGAAVMILLTIGGLLLLVRRSGGWRRLFRASGGSFAQRLHVEAGRFALAGLGLLAVSGLYMSLTTLGVVGGSGSDGFLAFAESSGGPSLAVADMPALQSLALADFRELVFPAQGDPYDVFSLTTVDGSGSIDQATGQIVDFTENTTAQNLYQLAFALHAGQGAWAYALFLGLSGLCVPLLFVSGLVTWGARVRKAVRIAGNEPGGRAETVILVGSEGNTTWGFARSLHATLRAEGQRVHTAPMNELAGSYAQATRLIVLAATYGDGDAPASASRFLSRLARFQAGSGLGYSVVGFGDSGFPAFCAYAKEVELALRDKGVKPLLEMAAIDRQSSQQFANWSRDLGQAMGIDLKVEHTAERPDMATFECVSRRDYGQAYQTPKSVLRLRAVSGGKRRWGRMAGPKYSAGDLIGILPKGSDIPRFYSLASGTADGYLEIAVSKQPGGLCSGQLCQLSPGDQISGFIKPNARFHLPAGKAPAILIGAGTGVAPLVGMVRGNRPSKPVYLFAGSRDPDCDLLYRDEIEVFTRSGRLTKARLSFSRVPGGAYVQDALRADADELRRAVRKGAHIMICGGRDMAEGVRDAFAEVLAPLDLSVTELRAAGRYMEDVY